MNWQFTWITSWDEIFSAKFQAQWLEWAEQASNSHVFSHPALGRPWVEVNRVLRAIEPLFLIARNESSTIFFPLVLWRRNWKNAFQSLIVPIGYTDFDYHDPLLISPPSSVLRSPSTEPGLPLTF